MSSTESKSFEFVQNNLWFSQRIFFFFQRYAQNRKSSEQQQNSQEKYLTHK